MEIILNIETIGILTYRGVLAYVAAKALGDGQWSTAQLAQAVSCNSSLMLEGLHELHEADGQLVGKQTKSKWPVGTRVASDEQVQILDSSAGRRVDFLDDIKAIFEWANKDVDLKFTMAAADGQAVQRWLKQHKDWTREMWRTALRNRFLSEGVVKSQYIYLWLSRLNEYLAHPKDRFGKEMPNGIGGKYGEALAREQSNDAARRAAVAAAGSHA
jgi:hypothetical protein